VSTTYNRGRYLFASTGLDWLNNDVQILLLDNVAGYIADATHNTVADVAAYELGAVANYVRKSLGTKSVTEDDVAGEATLGAADPVWTSLGACEVQGAVVFKAGVDDLSSELIGFLDGAQFPATHGGSGDFKVKFGSGVVAKV
jgi:hypothetical protein